MERYTVSQWSKKLNIHRVTLYKKIKEMREQLEGHISYQNDIMLIDEEGIKILIPDNYKEEEKETSIRTVEDYINRLEEQNTMLLEEIDYFKKELEKKNNQIDQLTQLVHNSQILLKDKLEFLEKKEPRKKTWFQKLFSKEE